MTEQQATVPPARVRRRLIRAEMAYVIGLAAFAVLAVFAHIYAYFGWDLAGMRYLQSFGSIAGFMRVLSTFGNGPIPFIIAAVTFIAFWVARLRIAAWALLLSVAGGEAMNRVIKLIIGRPRPIPSLVEVMQIETSESFPSGHVTFYVCYFGFLFFLAYAHLPRNSAVRRIALVLSALPVILIGFSRVYLGAHWPSDTIGAYMFAGMWLGLSLHFYRKRISSLANGENNNEVSQQKL